MPELVPIRYGRMLVSPFTFFRGAALIMAADLAATARSGLNVQSCGHAHLSNFGVFASPERRLMFDINDFDETLPGPWEWDLKRWGASLEVAGRDCRYSAAERRKVVLTGAAEYRTQMQQAAGLRNLDVWYTHIEVERLFELSKTSVSGKQLAKAKSTAAKARTGDTMQAFSKLTREVDGERRIIADRPLIVPVEDLLPEVRQRGEVEAQLRGLICSYRRTLETDRRHLAGGVRVRPHGPEGSGLPRRHPGLVTSSTEPSPTSRPPAPTRTNATSKHSSTPSSPAASPPRPACVPEGDSFAKARHLTPGQRGRGSRKRRPPVGGVASCWAKCINTQTTPVPRCWKLPSALTSGPTRSRCWADGALG